MTNPSTIPRSLALNTFYGAHSRFAVQSQGDIRHLSRAARAVQPLLVPLPEHEQCGCRPQPEHEPRDGRSDDGTYISQFRKAPGGGAGFHRPPRRARGTLTRRTDPGRGQGCLHGPRTFTSPHLTDKQLTPHLRSVFINMSYSPQPQTGATQARQGPADTISQTHTHI